MTSVVRPLRGRNSSRTLPGALPPAITFHAFGVRDLSDFKGVFRARTAYQRQAETYDFNPDIDASAGYHDGSMRIFQHGRLRSSSRTRLPPRPRTPDSR